MRQLALFLVLVWATPWALAQQTPYDCAEAGHNRDFDFWLGQWEVHDKTGKLQGENTIKALQKGCLLDEQWHSASGGTGQSINYYNPITSQWHQLWVDAGASIIDISGGLDEGSMVLTGSIYYLKAHTKKGFRGRWTLLPDGRVRQFFEEQNADGEWATWFEGFYSRVGTD